MRAPNCRKNCEDRSHDTIRAVLDRELPTQMTTHVHSKSFLIVAYASTWLWGRSLVDQSGVRRPHTAR